MFGHYVIRFLEPSFLSKFIFNCLYFHRLCFLSSSQVTYEQFKADKSVDVSNWQFSCLSTHGQFVSIPSDSQFSTLIFCSFFPRFLFFKLIFSLNFLSRLICSCETLSLLGVDHNSTINFEDLNRLCSKDLKLKRKLSSRFFNWVKVLFLFSVFYVFRNLIDLAVWTIDSLILLLTFCFFFVYRDKRSWKSSKKESERLAENR